MESAKVNKIKLIKHSANYYVKLKNTEEQPQSKCHF